MRIILTAPAVYIYALCFCAINWISKTVSDGRWVFAIY